MTPVSIANSAGPDSRSVVGRLTQTLGQWLRALIANRALRAAEIELQSLSDRVLKDIGLDPNEVRSLLTAAAGLDRRIPPTT